AEVKARVSDLISSATYQGVADLQRAMAGRPDTHAAIKDFRGPLLSIRGSEDTIATAADHELIMKNAIEGIHFEVPNVGHLPPLENPSAVSKLIVEFLQKLIAGSC
ncbi:MAG: hypothetical protein RL038_107, partial [Actinomycetota bacterium]